MRLVRCNRCKEEVKEKYCRSVLMEDLCKTCYDKFAKWFDQFLKSGDKV